MMATLQEEHHRMVDTVISKLVARSAALRNLNTAATMQDTEATTARKLEREVEREANAVNVTKYAMLGHLYEVDKYTAMRRLIRIALTCALFSTVVLFLGIGRVIHAWVATLLCICWWTMLLFVVWQQGRKYLVRDKLYWDKYVWLSAAPATAKLSS